MHFLPGQNFDCSGCAKCCRSPWQVSVDAASRRRMRELPIALVQSEGGAWVTPKVNGACAFLTPENLCGVHAQLGEDAKPHTCRQFPFLATRTPDGVFVGVSFFCSAVQRNEGRPLAAHTPDFNLPEPPPLLELKEGTFLTWEAYREMEEFLTGRAAVGHALLALALVPAGELTSVRNWLHAPLAPPSSMVTWMETSFVAGLLARLEGSADDPNLLQNLVDDHPVVLGKLRASEVQGRLIQGQPEWLPVELERYRAGLVWRKFLLDGGRPLLENLLILHLILRVAEFTTFAHALARGVEHPEPEDYHAALERCELDLITHGREASAMSRSFLWFLLEHLTQSTN